MGTGAAGRRTAPKPRRSAQPLNSPSLEIADYDAAQDAAAVARIWREVGWIDAERQGLVGRLYESGRGVVFRIDGSAECAVHTAPGAMRYLEQDLELSVVTAVTTSRVGRKLGAAGRLTALSLANAAREGAEVSALGAFEQGFYDRLGFGCGPYEHEFTFDPASLNVDSPIRPPRRLTTADWQAVRGCMLRRKRGHGGCILTPPQVTECELGWTEDFFGLGYYDAADGSLSHFIWGEARDAHGPYEITWIGYEDIPQLMELLSLIRSLGDQVNAVSMLEPADIRLQDVLKQPFRHRRSTEGGKYANRCDAIAFWQARLLDLPKCLAKTRLAGQDLVFNLELQDPAPARLDGAYGNAGADWPGAGGAFTVTLGSASGAEHGHHPSLPTLKASVGAFTRMWLGAAPASVLAVTDDIKGDPALLEALDDKFACLPTPRLGWDF